MCAFLSLYLNLYMPVERVLDFLILVEHIFMTYLFIYLFLFLICFRDFPVFYSFSYFSRVC